VTSNGFNHDQKTVQGEITRFCSSLLGNFGSKDEVAEDCVVSNCLGDYGDAFAVTGGNACILNCRAYLPYLSYSWVGINCAGFNNTKIIGNEINGGSAGFYMDTGSADTILMEGNTFENVRYGIDFNNGYPITNIMILGNEIHLATNSYNPSTPNIGITVTYGPNAYSVNICNNIIVGNNTGAGEASLLLGQITGGIVANNMLDNRLVVRVQTDITNIWIFNNVDQNGSYAVFNSTAGYSPQTSPPNPVKRIDVTSNYTITLNDYFIGIPPASSPLMITLPSAQQAGSGKTYIIQKENGSGGTVAVLPQSGQSINGTAGIAITSAYGALTVISDGNSSWYAH
jgi:hypothetical protein